MNIPYYLQKKLVELSIYEIKQIEKLGYLEIFSQLKLAYPSLSYQGLFDLYCLDTKNLFPDKDQQQTLIYQYKQMVPRYQPLDREKVDYYLSLAGEQAKLALNIGEIPIGAVIVYNDKIIGKGYNQTRTNTNILAHAEIQAIKEAQEYLQNYRLDKCDLYVTIEPCLMCSGAIINSRIQRLVYGASEFKTGACSSQYQVFKNKKTNHHCEVIGPIDQEHYSKLISRFFSKNESN